MTDTLSRKHFDTVRTEMEGRFFSPHEAFELKLAIDRRTISDPELRAGAAKCWPEDPEEKG